MPKDLGQLAALRGGVSGPRHSLQVGNALRLNSRLSTARSANLLPKASPRREKPLSAPRAEA